MNDRVLCLGFADPPALNACAAQGFELRHASRDQIETWPDDIHAGIIVLDVRDDTQALAHIETLKRQYPDVRILLIVEEEEDEQVLLRFLFAGAVGYISHEQALNNLAAALRAVRQNQAWLPRQMVSRLIDTITRLDRR